MEFLTMYSGASLSRVLVGQFGLSVDPDSPYWDEIQSRALYDMAAVAIVKNGSWAEKVEIPAPIMIDEKWVDQPGNPRTVLIVILHKDEIIAF